MANRTANWRSEVSHETRKRNEDDLFYLIIRTISGSEPVAENEFRRKIAHLLEKKLFMSSVSKEDYANKVASKIRVMQENRGARNLNYLDIDRTELQGMPGAPADSEE